MLQKIQKLTSGVFAWLFAILIAVSFVLWGVEARFFTGGKSQTDYATINGETITMIEVERVFRNLRDNFYSQNQQMTPSAHLDKQLRNSAFDQLVVMKLIYQYAMQNGLFAGDSQIEAYISKRFFGSNKIDPVLLERFIRSQGYPSHKEFREELLTQYTGWQVQQGLYASEFLTEDELTQWLQLLKQERNVSVLSVESENFKDVKVSDEEVKQYFEANKENFKKPERVSIEYIEFSNEDARKQIQVTDDKALEYYETHKKQFTEEGQWKLAHILIRTDDIEKAKAQEKANSLYGQLKKGANFKLLAKKHSDDALTNSTGGELAWLGKAMVSPKIVGALDKLKTKGQILEPIETEAGFEIFKVLDIKPEAVQPFKEVRSEIIETIKKEQAARVMADLTEQLSELTFTNPDSLIPAADTLGLEIKSTDKFELNQPKAGLLSNAKVRQTAFSPDVLLDRNNSDIIPITEDLAVVIRVKEHEAARLLTFDEAKKTATTVVKRLKQVKRSKEVGLMLLEKLKNKKSIQAEMKKYKLKWVDYKKATRGSNDIDPKIKNIIFRVPSDPSKKVHGFLNNDDYTIVNIKSISHAKLEDVSEKERGEFKAYLVGQYGNYLFEAYLDQLKDKADVNILAQTEA